MQSCGWKLIDTPHVHPKGSSELHAKEVADKMIIVDALLYCMSHQDGATLCFITADADFAYLLSKLRSFPAIRTIVVHSAVPNVKSSSLLGASANHVLSWDDILGRPSALVPDAAQRNRVAKPPPQAPTVQQPSRPEVQPVVDYDPQRRRLPDELLSDSDADDSYDYDISASDDPDSLALVLGILIECEEMPGATVLRSLVGSRLKQTNPLRFGKGVVSKTLQTLAREGHIALGGPQGKEWCRRNLPVHAPEKK